MNIDPWILAFSAVTVVVTIWMGFRSARTSKTASDFFVAGRSVGVGMNASAISGEYLSAASFMGVAGMVMSSGYDALWYPVCYACGYLFLLLFIAGPLRRFGAYTIPDFAEGRFDSPLFRKIAVVFVLFIGFFYTMPQMKGAGTTLAYIFPGLPYWAGVVLVGAVITLNVALGGMKGITLVQAFQYWAKMFAISVPIFVLMTVYGHYGKQVGVNGEQGGKGEGAQGGITPAPSPPFSPSRASLPAKAPRDETWLNPFGPLTTKAAKAAAAALTNRPSPPKAALRGPETASFDASASESSLPALVPFERGRVPFEKVQRENQRVHVPNEKVQRWSERVRVPFGFGAVPSGSSVVPFDSAAVPFGAVAVPSGAAPVPGERGQVTSALAAAPQDPAAVQKAWLDKHEKPLALLYTYSLIIALVCGTAGLPHILVRFYTNPDGVAAKRTTMWVMILIGVFYVFPPVFGVMGRNLMPALYEGVGAKGTDKVVLELPRMLNEQGGRGEGEKRGKGEEGRNGEIPSAPLPPGSSAAATATTASKRFPWGSILSGITCAGAFAAFMSTFSGLLVSMTGALAHDVYGRMLRPQATPAQRMRMFKIAAVVIGGVAIALGMQVEPLQINFMVGQAFAIAAASYFPLLFVSVWWRKLTMKGAATGMLTGGTLALAGISLTSFSDLKWLPLDAFWAANPLLRILCEQPAIWAVPLAITLMVVVSLFTQREVPADIRMKMLVLHAPEKLGLKQEYIQEHQPGH